MAQNQPVHRIALIALFPVDKPKVAIGAVDLVVLIPEHEADVVVIRSVYGDLAGQLFALGIPGRIVENRRVAINALVNMKQII